MLADPEDEMKAGWPGKAVHRMLEIFSPPGG